MTISVAQSVSSAIPDLDSLTVKASDWLDRDDLTDKIPMFIALAEALFNRELRCPQMENTITFSAAAEDTPQPAQDFLSMRSIYIEGSPDRALRATSPSSVRQEYNGTAGTPEAYILIAGGIRLVPPPDTTYSLTMDYYAKLRPLSVIAPSNWLLETHPDAYLWAVLSYAEEFLDNTEKSQRYMAYAMGIIAQINQSVKQDRYGAGPISRTTTAQTCGGRC